MSQTRFLWTGYFALGVIMAGLVLINPNHFTSIDSGYYLQSATNLLAGRGYVIQENGQLTWNGTFPIGYSALIAAVSGLAGLPVLVASKLVNYLAIGVSISCWTKRVGSTQAVWLLGIWGLGSFLKIAVYSWSETVFLVLLAEWVWCLHQLLRKPITSRALTLYLIGSGLFLTRYAGGFVFGLTGVLAILAWLSPGWLKANFGIIQQRLLALKLVIISAAGLVSMLAYFWMNQQVSGSYFGGERFVSTESPIGLARIFSWAILNECLLIRDFVPEGANKLAWFGMIIQLVLFGVLYRQLLRNHFSDGKLPVITLLIWLFALTAVFYLFVLLTVRVFSPFSNPNFRLMAPFTFCLLLALSLWIFEWPMHKQRLLRPWGLLLCSWLQLVPETNLIPKLEQIWEQLAISLASF